MPELNAVGIVASDLGRSIGFYRLLGADLPETPDEIYARVTGAGFHGGKEPWDALLGPAVRTAPGPRRRPRRPLRAPLTEGTK